MDFNCFISEKLIKTFFHIFIWLEFISIYMAIFYHRTTDDIDDIVSWYEMNESFAQNLKLAEMISCGMESILILMLLDFLIDRLLVLKGKLLVWVWGISGHPAKWRPSCIWVKLWYSLKFDRWTVGVKVKVVGMGVRYIGAPNKIAAILDLSKIVISWEV